MPATRLKLQQAFNQSPALKLESSVKTRTKRYQNPAFKPEYFFKPESST